MRMPIDWRAPSVEKASNMYQPGSGSTLSFPRKLISVIGLSAAMVCVPAAQVFAQNATEYEDTQSAVMSPLASLALLIDVVKVGDRLVAVGSRGHIVYSDDQGASWQQADVPTRQMLTAVNFINANEGWAVGHDSLILHTTDGGESWTIQYRDPALQEEIDEQGPGLLERPLMDVWFRDANTGFAVGAYGLMLRTEDGGETWNEVDDVDNPNGFHYNAIAPIEGAGLFLVGEMGTVYRSPDYGDTWETLTDVPYDGSWFGVTGTGDTGVVLAWGLRGNMFRSEDFGDTWRQIELTAPDGDPLESTLFGGGASADGQEIVVVGVGGIVAVSEDRGRSFSVAVRPDRAALASATVLENGQLLLVGQRGVVKAAENGLPANR